MSELTVATYPATFHELGYAYALRERRPWYLVERGDEIGLTSEVEQGDEVISTYEND